MNNLKATIRKTATTGQLNKLRDSGFIPGILYGGKDINAKISIDKKLIKNILNSESFLSSVLNLDLDGNKLKVIPRDVSYNVISDEPIHIDLMRVVPGTKIVLEIPVKFINNIDCPGLKVGGVLNIVRRKIELKCPAENIPEEIIVDLKGLEIGTSIKISSIKLPENVTPTITGRDFVIATVAAPTVMKEPEKPAEEVAAEGTEGAVGTEAVAGAEGAKPAEGKEGDTVKKDDKAQATEKKQSEKK
ncbi:50S ribosomal protein L25/general stress protein Ctc [Pelagibacteraceae bacterium]|mgnify:FL=1|jgi:large subunit ribosomal protein L25|nr:50S ribosomal protein L25/general stress protein Ctc [Pelagibacteraceae bacterium]|tara:strand:- start:243 stop:980 length:738 start_codon:yes stop_codon:yes gene_type:complete